MIVVVATILNDAGRWFNAQAQLNESTAELASAASATGRTTDRDTAAHALEAIAVSHGFTISQYGQDPNGLQIWTEADVHGTWVAGTYRALLNGVPLGQAVGAPLVVKDYQQAQFR